MLELADFVIVGILALLLYKPFVYCSEKLIIKAIKAYRDSGKRVILEGELLPKEKPVPKDATK